MPDETPHHHGSHRDLLWSPADSLPKPQGIDAIIVPTARHPAHLSGSAELAQVLGCTLVTLHSGKWTSAAEAARRIPAKVDLIAIDVPAAGRLRLPDWETSRRLDGRIFARRTDTSAKRNLALMLGYMLGWSRVLFLDDDITGVRADDVRKASGLLDIYSAVGFQVTGFPDHSVVCHAYRQAGGKQESFIGGGALAVHIERNKSFFPDIYNEDWFFLLNGDKQLQATGIAGQVVQSPYDPFRIPERARAQEFGDVLAEGIYWLLDQNKSIAEADEHHWAAFLEKRRQFIRDVLDMVRNSQLEADEERRRVAALKGSLGRLALIEPQLCVNYLHDWAGDWQRWQSHTQELPAGVSPSAALTHLSRPGTPRLTRRLGGRGTGSVPRPFTT